MANQKYDGVVESVHYAPDGRVEWVRAYLRRGIAWSDWVIIPRESLIKEIKSGKRVMVGKRVEYMAGTFDVTTPLQVVGKDGKEFLTTSSSTTDRDLLEGVPVL